MPTTTVQEVSIMATVRELIAQVAMLRIHTEQYSTALLENPDLPLFFEDMAVLAEIQELEKKLLDAINARMP